MPNASVLTLDKSSQEGVIAKSVVSLIEIGRVFPGVHALNDVSLELVAGCGHALVGENGAGKSTLVKIISGLLQPSTGRIAVDGAAVTFRSPAEARRHGISLVPQELSLAADRSVAENIYMGQLPAIGPFVQNGLLHAQAHAVLQRLALDIDPGSPLDRHAPAVQQLVMIARGIASRSRVFILDEPTASLTDPEIERLFVVLRDLKAKGSSLLYISHRLNELREIVEDITVLRDGLVVDRLLVQAADEQALVRAMIGRPIERLFDTHASGRPPGRVLLSVQGLCRAGTFENISFQIRAGEIVGLSGLVGAGRTEVARAIFGIDRLDAGVVEVDGTALRLRSPRDAIAAGIVLIPEERKSQGLVLDRSIYDNIVLPHLRELSTGRFFKEDRLVSYGSRVSKSVGVKTPSVMTAVRTLSGGNQQKVVLGRWLTSKPKVYILDEPTRGIDVQAKAEIYAQVGRLSDEGAAVLVISSELPEVLGICQRIMVMRFGRIVGEIEADEACEQTLLQLAMVDEFLVPPKDARRLPPAAAPADILALDAGPVGEPGRSYHVAFLQADGNTAWSELQRASLMAEAARYPNIVVEPHAAHGDARLQARTLDEAVAQRVDAVILEPVDLALSTPAVERASRQGVPVIGIGGNIASRAYDCWIWQDLPGVAASLIDAPAVGAGARSRIVEIPGRIGSSKPLLLHDGLSRAAVSQAGARLSATRPTDGSVPDTFSAAQRYLQSASGKHVWFVHDVEAVQGVREALDAAGHKDEPIIAIGAPGVISTAIRNGRIAAGAGLTVHGDLALRAVACWFSGRAVPKDIILAVPPVMTGLPD